MRRIDYTNALNARVNIEKRTIPATGVDNIALPVTAANTGMQVQLFGQSAENLVVNGDFRNGTTGWTSHLGSTLSIADGKLKVALASTTYGAAKKDNIPVVSGNKYYKAIVLSHDSTVVENLNFQLGPSSDLSPIQPNTRAVRTIVQTISATGNTPLYVGKHSQSTVFNIYIEKVMLVNLTATFGAGNEPTKEQCDLLFANYFEGTANTIGTGRVRSVGKNLLNLNTYGKKIYNGQSDRMTTSQRLVFYDIIMPITRTGVQTGTITQHLIDINNVELTSPLANYGIGFKIKAKEGDTFNLSSIAANGYVGVGAFSASGIYIANYVNRTFTVAAGTDFILLVFTPTADNTKATFTNTQISRGLTVNVYEPYRESILQLTTPDLRSNGLIKDEIRKGSNGYELVKRVGVGTLGANIITGGDFETGLTTPALPAFGCTWVWNSATKDATLTSTANDNTQLLLLQASAGVAAGDVWIVDFYAKSSNVTGVPVSTTPPSTVKSAVIEPPLSTSYQRYVYSYKFTASDHIRVIFKNMGIGGEITIDNLSIRKLNESSLAGSPILTFIGSNIHYTLATPIITPIAHAGLLNSNSNGTVYFEPAIKDIITYTDKAEISDTDYPISSIESIEKNGIAVNPATAVIAEGGLSLTHPDLEFNDEVELIYSYNKESTGRGMRLLFYNKA